MPGVRIYDKLRACFPIIRSSRSRLQFCRFYNKVSSSFVAISFNEITRNNANRTSDLITIEYLNNLDLKPTSRPTSSPLFSSFLKYTHYILLESLNLNLNLIKLLDFLNTRHSSSDLSIANTVAAIRETRRNTD